MSYIGNTPGDKFLTLEKQVFTTSATDTYSLDRGVSSVNDIELFLNNVRQEPTEAYTISGTTLTLASAITASDSMYCIYQGRAVGTQSPASGSVTNDMLAGSIATSKLADGSTFATTNGITMVDRWRLTTGFTGTATPISSNLERADETGAGFIGTGMTESSGVFTFPSTGIYLIQAFFNLRLNGDIRDHNQQIQTTTDNSSFSSATGGDSFIQQTQSSNTYTTSFHSYTFDVTSTSTHKVRFYVDSDANTSTEVRGSSTFDLTSFTFIRLGDT